MSECSELVDRMRYTAQSLLVAAEHLERQEGCSCEEQHEESAAGDTKAADHESEKKDEE